MLHCKKDDRKSIRIMYISKFRVSGPSPWPGLDDGRIATDMQLGSCA